MTDREKIEVFLAYVRNKLLDKYPNIVINTIIFEDEITYGFTFFDIENKRMMGQNYVGLHWLSSHWDSLVNHMERTLNVHFFKPKTKQVFCEVDPFGEEEWEC
jgi:hypothetical protein